MSIKFLLITLVCALAFTAVKGIVSEEMKRDMKLLRHVDWVFYGVCVRSSWWEAETDLAMYFTTETEIQRKNATEWYLKHDNDPRVRDREKCMIKTIFFYDLLKNMIWDNMLNCLESQPRSASIINLKSILKKKDQNIYDIIEKAYYGFDRKDEGVKKCLAENLQVKSNLMYISNFAEDNELLPPVEIDEKPEMPISNAGGLAREQMSDFLRYFGFFDWWDYGYCLAFIKHIKPYDQDMKTTYMNVQSAADHQKMIDKMIALLNEQETKGNPGALECMEQIYDTNKYRISTYWNGVRDCLNNNETLKRDAQLASIMAELNKTSGRCPIVVGRLAYPLLTAKHEGFTKCVMSNQY